MARFTDIQKWIKYHSDYYSGAQVSVFFGDTWVDDIVTLQFSGAQQMSPIYGYASQLYDAVAEGQYIVNGQFTIAFKEVGYLNLIMDKIKGRNALANKTYEDLQMQRRQKEWQRLEADKNAVEVNDQGKFVNKSPLMGWTFTQTQNGYPIRQPRISRSNIENQITELGSATGRGFESLAENLEDLIWGVKNTKFSSDAKSIRRPDQFNTVGLYDANKDRYIDPKGFNILLTYGDINTSAAEHTVQSLIGVHITEVAQVIMPNGEPIAEQYTFFARDMNKAIDAFDVDSAKTEESVAGNYSGEGGFDPDGTVYLGTGQVTYPGTVITPGTHYKLVGNQPFYLTKLDLTIRQGNVSKSTSINVAPGVVEATGDEINKLEGKSLNVDGGGSNAFDLKVLQAIKEVLIEFRNRELFDGDGMLRVKFISPKDPSELYQGGLNFTLKDLIATFGSVADKAARSIPSDKDLKELSNDIDHSWVGRQ